MTSTADFLPLFASCKTPADTNSVYKSHALKISADKYSLMEAHRLSLVRVTAGQSAVVVKPGVDSSVATQKSHDALVRQWATQSGLVFRRVSKQLRAQYEAAHSEENK